MAQCMRLRALSSVELVQLEACEVAALAVLCIQQQAQHRPGIDYHLCHHPAA